jgi:hypothetical protein
MVDDDVIQASADRLEACNSLAELLGMVAAFNGHLGPEGITLVQADRLRGWLDKLVAKLNELVPAVAAQSFTLTVGTHVMVAVTFGAAHSR